MIATAERPAAAVKAGAPAASPLLQPGVAPERLPFLTFILDRAGAHFADHRRGVEPLDRLMEPALQARHAGEGRIGHRPRRERWDRHVALDERQRLAALLVDAERPLHVVEPNVLQVLQEREDRLGESARGPAHRVADPHHLSQVGDPAGELLLLGVHAGRIAMRYAMSWR